MKICAKHQMEEDLRTGFFGANPFLLQDFKGCVICNPPVKISRSRRKHLWRKRRNLNTRKWRLPYFGSDLMDIYLCGEIARISEILKSGQEQK